MNTARAPSKSGQTLVGSWIALRAGAMPRHERDEVRNDGSTRGTPWRLLGSMILAIGIVAGLAWCDEQREATAALHDLEVEQSTVASSLAAALRARLSTLEDDALLIATNAASDRRASYAPATVRSGRDPQATAVDSSRVCVTVPLPDGRRADLGVTPAELLGQKEHAAPVGDLSVFLWAPNESWLRATDARRIESPPLIHALENGSSTARLTRPEAAQVGLAARTAMAGLGRVDGGPLGKWGVVVVASAARERDRQKRALARLLLGVLVTSGLVLSFGGFALRKQRRELELGRELAVADAQRAGEDALAEAQRIATMGTFAMGIAHEVATPLAVISGRAEQLLGRVQSDERAVRGAQTILNETDHIQQIVRRFLDMARGGMPSLERANPAEVTRSAVASVEHRFRRANVALTMDIPTHMPEVECDRALLEHAIVNLLLNACDACRAGAHVVVQTHVDVGRVAFVVTDTGAGITSQQAAVATLPFFTTKPRGKGTGLGLAIAAEIAKSHRGTLSIAPNAPRGTRASIAIPFAGETAPAPLE